jgi:2-amino-4-hydroxy-6-hydroxymethyldihydropteridine diphosphokinase
VNEIAYIALGSNLGDRAAYLASARVAVASLPGCRLRAATRVEETAPLGAIPQGPYLNQMLAVCSTLDPIAMLDHLQRIERRLGRVRGMRWGPRTIDLDIVRFGAHRMNVPGLTLPHPGIPERPFWQREIAALDRALSNAR